MVLLISFADLTRDQAMFPGAVHLFIQLPIPFSVSHLLKHAPVMSFFS